MTLPDFINHLYHEKYINFRGTNTEGQIYAANYHGAPKPLMKALTRQTDEVTASLSLGLDIDETYLLTLALNFEDEEPEIRQWIIQALEGHEPDIDHDLIDAKLNDIHSRSTEI